MDRLNSTTKRTGAATAGSGVAVTGTVHGPITVGAPHLVLSAYRQQVRRIAPERLLGRDDELAELAEFCHAESGAPYRWWQAPAWAGKSALMSWFTLNPPERVSVVSFFITARFSGHSDRMAFVDVILEQLAAVAGEPLPGFLTEATKEAHLLEMLDKAAEVCARQDRRLMLVVDGLDEDQGVTVGADAYSIAALLPVHPPENVRIVVTGRPHPPVPSDVPDDHPLHQRAVVHRLETSPYAQVIRTDAERELKRLLLGQPAEQELLGLVTAAGGGLSAKDLSELTGSCLWDIEQHMRAVSGRTFARLAGRWSAGAGTEVYVLAHEELQHTAMKWLGHARLTEYRERLHKWADGYRARGWPADTPKYLLRGYFLLLQAIGAHDWMLACALDQVRHDRMLNVTGGDAAALAEIVTVQRLQNDASEADLAALLRLAVARERLTSRNAHLPLGLPALWARLDNLGRAEALARSIVEPERQAEAFSRLLRATAGKQDTVWPAEQGEAAIQLITDPYRRAEATAHLVGAVAAVGDFDRAERLIHTINDPYRQAQKLVQLVDAVAAARDFERAERLIHTINDPRRQAQATTVLVRRMAESGDLDRAEKLARSLTHPIWLTRAMVDLVATSAERDKLRWIIEQAEKAVAALYDDGQQFDEWVRLAAALAATGDIEAAEEFAMRAPSLHLRVHSLVAVLRAATGHGPERLDALASRAARLAGAAPHETWRATDLAITVTGLDRLAPMPAVTTDNAEWQAQELAELAIAAAGRCSPATVREIADKVTAASAIAGTKLREEQRIELAVALTRIGDHEHAAALLSSIHDPGTRTRVLVRQLTVGEWDVHLMTQGEALISEVPDGALQARLLVELADAAIATGHRDHAQRLAERAEAVARSIAVTDVRAKERVEQALVRAALAMSDTGRATALAGSASSAELQDALLADVVTAAASDGDLVLAHEMTLRIADPYRRGCALVALLETVGDDDGENDSHAERLVTTAEKLSSSLTGSSRQTDFLNALIRALAARGETDRALKVAHWFADPHAQAEVLPELLALVLAHGDQQLVRAVVSLGVNVTHSIASSERRAEALIEMVRAAVTAGDTYCTGELAWEAERTTRWIIEPEQRARTMTTLVQVLAGSGQHALTARIMARAEVAIDLVESSDETARALIELMAVVAAAGIREEADRLAAAAESAIRAVPNAYERAWLQADLVAALASTPYLEVILAQADFDLSGTPGPPTSFESGLMIGGGTKSCSHPDLPPWLDAVLPCRIAYPDQRARALAALALVAAERGYADVGERIADAILDSHERNRALTGLARVAAADGDLERATALIQDGVHREGMAPVLTEFVRFAVAGDDLNQTDMFTRYLDPEERATLMLDLMGDDPALARRLADRAEAAIGEVARPGRKAELLTAYAQVLARAGDCDRAETAARAIPDLPAQAQALAAVAVHAQPARARRLSAEILSTDSWTTSLSVLAHLEPTVVAAVADDLLRPHRTSLSWR